MAAPGPRLREQPVQRRSRRSRRRTRRTCTSSWTFSTGVLRGHEGQPLVVDNTMYVVTPYPNVAYALDLTQPGFPLKWKYRPENAQAAVGIACCDVVNRGAAYADGKIVYNLLDGHTVAVDAATGKELWRTKMGDVERGETITMAPIVVKNKVIVGSSGGEMGVRGWIAALDLATGKQLWRAYNIGPDADIKVGAALQAVLRAGSRHEPRRDELAGRLVEDRRRDGVGLAVVRSRAQPHLSRHVEPGPWNGNQRPGDNKWSAAIIARDADTGEMVWAFQPTPHDIWDYDAVNENILVDLPIDGTDAQGARPLRPQRLRVHDRPRDGRGAAREAVRADELGVGRRPQDGPPERRTSTRRRRRART